MISNVSTETESAVVNEKEQATEEQQNVSAASSIATTINPSLTAAPAESKTDETSHASSGSPHGTPAAVSAEAQHQPTVEMVPPLPSAQTETEPRTPVNRPIRSILALACFMDHSCALSIHFCPCTDVLFMLRICDHTESLTKR